MQVADRDVGSELAQFAKFSDRFLKTAVRIMEADADFENGLELSGVCRKMPRV